MMSTTTNPRISEPLRSVLIVGGGSAGWMSAAYLRTALGSRVDICLVESERLAPIGVGEATVNTMGDFFDFLGVTETEWMPPCQATYKTAIKFSGWRGDGRHFYHPFERRPDVGGASLASWWLRLRRHQAPFDYTCFSTPRLCDALRAPRHADGSPFLNATSQAHAYHLDAGRLAGFLQALAIRRGVHHELGDVVSVARAEDGSVRSVGLEDGRVLSAELFIDCTGFRGLLINESLDEPFESYGDHLLCDRAVAIQVPYPDSETVANPFTTATAQDAGWIWETPLAGRRGVGYVYSSAFVSQDEAETTLRSTSGVSRASEGDALHIAMRVGRCRRSWVANCVAIGLASGFVEPLESTGLFFIHHALNRLVQHWPGHDGSDRVREPYNRQIAECFDGVRDFLHVHYALSDRRDTPFWRAATEATSWPGDMRERAEHWLRRVPDETSVPSAYHGFDAYSYEAVVLGLGWEPQTSPPILELLDAQAADRVFKRIARETGKLERTLPRHDEYLRDMYEAAAGDKAPG